MKTKRPRITTNRTANYEKVASSGLVPKEVKRIVSSQSDNVSFESAPRRELGNGFRTAFANMISHDSFRRVHL
jgi:hypothetical protein